MTCPGPPRPRLHDESSLAAFGRAVQGVILERFTLGVALMALVVLAAGALEAERAARAVAVAVGVGVLAVTLVGWRRRWSDPVMWGAMLVSTAACFAAFVLAVS